MKVRTSLIGLLVVCGIGVGSIGTAAAQPAGPPAGYNINPEFTEKSPDGAITIEQYVNKEPTTTNGSSGCAERAHSLCSIRSRPIIQRGFASPTI
jgi:hypothetical protein